ncbi:hypothetical protein [Stenotrophomonas sp.]|uniref:hypothetical protein n=1 Tax=Stenotrophomonas sp. TaxID=69392 RepID=UPI002FCA66FE
MATDGATASDNNNTQPHNDFDTAKPLIDAARADAARAWKDARIVLRWCDRAKKA